MGFAPGADGADDEHPREHFREVRQVSHKPRVVLA